MNLTLLEVSLDDAKITANAPFSGHNTPDSDDAEKSERDESSIEVETGDVEAAGDASGGRSVAPIGAVVALVALLALAALVKRRRSGEESIEVE